MGDTNDRVASKAVASKVGSLRKGAQIFNAFGERIDEVEDKLRLRLLSGSPHVGRSAESLARNLGRELGGKIQSELELFVERRLDTLTTQFTRESGIKLKVPSRLPSIKLLGGSAEKWMEDAAANAAARARDVVSNDGAVAADAFRRLRADAQAVARSGSAAAHNAAVLAIAKANRDAISGVMAVATLDNKTTELCFGRHGSAWNLETGDPLPWSLLRIPFPGRPPWHFNCRTTLSPIFIGEDIPQSELLDQDAWLDTDDARDAFGDEQWSLYQEGRITRSQLINSSGVDDEEQV